MVTLKDLEDLAAALNLPVYDLLLVGDGSGTVAHRPCGSACVAYYKDLDTAKYFSSAFSHGSNNFAELVPYVHALQYDYNQRQFNATMRFKSVKSYPRVEIVTDSELTCKQGNKEYARNANTALWAAVDYFALIGYKIHWNWVARNSNPVNTICDEQSGKMRKLMMTALDSHRCVS
jgi:ribonuclease HI